MGALTHNPFTPEFWKWILPSLNWGMSIIAKRVSVHSQEQNDKQCRSRWDGSLWAISSGSILFAKVFILVYGAERVKVPFTTAGDNNFDFFFPEKTILTFHVTCLPNRRFTLKCLFKKKKKKKKKKCSLFQILLGTFRVNRMLFIIMLFRI